MLRGFLLALVALGFVSAVASGIRTAPHASAAPSAPIASAPDPTPAVAYRPGEPMLVLDNAATLAREGDGHFSTRVSVNGQPIDMVVDTGATTVALTIADARTLGIAVDPTTFRVVGSGASGPVTGQVVTLGDVAVGSRHVAQVEAVVLAGLGRSLLGQSYLRTLDRVTIDGDTMTLR